MCGFRGDIAKPLRSPLNPTNEPSTTGLTIRRPEPHNKPNAPPPQHSPHDKSQGLGDTPDPHPTYDPDPDPDPTYDPDPDPNDPDPDPNDPDPNDPEPNEGQPGLWEGTEGNRSDVKRSKDIFCLNASSLY